MKQKRLNRREVLAAAGGFAVSSTIAGAALAAERSMLKRPIPSSGEQIPVIGQGTYNVFDVASTPAEIAIRKDIVDMLTSAGGSVIDTSPMYARSEKVIGDVIAAGSERNDLFIATKVWTTGQDNGIKQMARSAELMNTEVIDLMQVHNLRDTAVHMTTIRDWQENGRIRYSGLTHYRASAMDELEAEMKKYKPQFIQINYSAQELEAENRVLPLAADMGIAVLINRPFRSGDLFRAVGKTPLPSWAAQFAESWAQVFLKFIIGHPVVTCAIPATSKPHHMRDNLGAGFGRLPDNAERQRIVNYIATL